MGLRGTVLGAAQSAEACEQDQCKEAPLPIPAALTSHPLLSLSIILPNVLFHWAWAGAFSPQ